MVSVYIYSKSLSKIHQPKEVAIVYHSILQHMYGHPLSILAFQNNFSRNKVLEYMHE